MVRIFQRLPSLVLLGLLFTAGMQSTDAQTAPARQIPAGTSTGLSPADGSAAATSPQGKILNGALTPETRKKLQEAMDAAPAH